MDVFTRNVGQEEVDKDTIQSSTYIEELSKLFQKKP